MSYGVHSGGSTLTTKSRYRPGSLFQMLTYLGFNLSRVPSRSMSSGQRCSPFFPATIPTRVITYAPKIWIDGLIF
jgi:hypothetical protein